MIYESGWVQTTNVR